MRFCLHVYVLHVSVWCPWYSEEASNPLELDLWMVGDCYVGARN